MKSNFKNSMQLFSKFNKIFKELREIFATVTKKVGVFCSQI